MANEITLFQSGNVIPDYLRDVDDFTKRISAPASAVKAISIEGGVWRLMDGSNEIARNEERSMQFVVVNVAEHIARTYYTGTYVKGVSTSPTCWSADGKTPDPSVVNPQHPSCKGCPQDIAGSGHGESRACRFSRRIAVTLPGDINGQVYRLQLPAKSMFGKGEGDKMPFNAYAAFLAGHGVPMSGVVTEARFDTSQAVPVLTFKAIRPLTREEVQAAREQSASQDAAVAVEFKLSPKEAKATAPAALPPTFTEETVAEVKEPVKRTTKKPPQEVAKSVAEIVDDWGSDDE